MELLQVRHDDYKRLVGRLNIVKDSLQAFVNTTSSSIGRKAHTEGSLSISKHKLKSGPDTVAERALMRMLMMTSGLLC